MNNILNTKAQLFPGFFDFDSYQLTQEKIEAYRQIYTKLKAAAGKMMGFPETMELEHLKILAPLLTVHINNYGDPFQKISTWNLEVKQQEQELLSFYANLYQLPMEQAWGYVTSGSTEAVLYALYLAREKYPDGILYSSDAAHVCVPKSASMLRIPHQIVPSKNDGEIDYESLEKSISQNRDKPAIICLTVGTTLTGAIDDVERILAILKRHQFSQYYIHLDMALMGHIIPFTALASKLNFQFPISSISISGHKFIGSPLTAAILLTRKNNLDNLQVINAPFVDSIDNTLSGSRAGLPILCWLLQLHKFGLTGLAQMSQYCFQLKEYALASLAKINWHAWSKDNSIIINLAMPSPEIRNRWQLATDENIAQSHLVLLPHLTKDHIDSLIDDLYFQQANKAINLCQELKTNAPRKSPDIESDNLSSEEYKRLYKLRKDASTISAQIVQELNQHLEETVNHKNQTLSEHFFNILSIGTGEGDLDWEIAKHVSQKLKPSQKLFYLGVEPNEEQRKLLVEKIVGTEYHLKNTIFQIRADPFEPSNQAYAVKKKFDVILMIQVAYYFENTLDTISYALNQLKPQGELLILHQQRAGVLEIREQFMPQAKKLITGEDIWTSLQQHEQYLQKNNFHLTYRSLDAQFDVSECVQKTAQGIDIMAFAMEKRLDAINHQQEIEQLANLFASQAYFNRATNQYLLAEPISFISITRNFS